MNKAFLKTLPNLMFLKCVTKTNFLEKILFDIKTKHQASLKGNNENLVKKCFD